MNKLSEFLLQKFLKKVMTCYCMDCVKKITEDTSRPVPIIHTAPKLITFTDTKLANPDGCLCLECIKLYAPNHTYKYHGKEILKFNDYPYYYDEEWPDGLLSCWCYDCMVRCMNVWKMRMYRPYLEICGISDDSIRFRKTMMYDTEYPYVDLSELKYTELSKIRGPIDSKNNIIHINKGCIVVYHIDWDSIEWHTDDEKYNDDYIKKYNGTCTQAKLSTLSKWIDIDDDNYVVFGDNLFGYLQAYTRRRQLPVYKWDGLTVFEEDIPKELLGNHDKIKKIMYYEEYLGYKLKYIDDSDEYYKIVEPPSISGHTFAADIIKYKTFEVENIEVSKDHIKLFKKSTSNKKYISKSEISIYYRIIDQYCYECNKYKGACLGHIYPDANEFKYVINQSPYISQLECRIMYLEQLVLQK